MPGTVVIGGGSAGIAAARRLQDAGEDVLLVEAKDRLGGRAHSVTLPLPGDEPRSVTMDLGCGWLHSARRNPWTQIAERSGVAVDRSAANWGQQWRDLGFPPAEQAAFGNAWDRWENAAKQALVGPDRPLSDFVAPDERWRPHLDAISGFANGAPLDQVSLHDWAAYDDASTEDNWTLPAGYGSLIAGHIGEVPVRLSTPVTRVDRGGRTLRLGTGAGAIEAERVIVAVPTSVLAREALRFDPPLPDKHSAAEALPLGVADKVILHAHQPIWPTNAHLIGNPYSDCTASHRLSPFGAPVIECFFGGRCADMLEGGDAAAFAIDELVRLLGSDWRARLTPLATTRWRNEDHIHGSYSHARVGCAGEREVLAAPVDHRLFFAGEACHPFDFSTAHGAYETGIAAADAVLASRGR